MNDDKLLVICGPTATGKSKFALKFAYEFGGELVSADARHVYKGLDILTGKDVPPGFVFHESHLTYDGHKLGYYANGSKIWLMDIVSRSELFNVYRYQAAAKIVLRFLISQKVLPIIVGGTGLYIDAITTDLREFRAPPDFGFRQKAEKLTSEDLQKILKKKNNDAFETLNESDRNNPRRLIRAIERAQLVDGYHKIRRYKRKNVLKIGLFQNMFTTEENIRLRIDNRLQSGVMEEVRAAKTEYKQSDYSYSAIGFNILIQVINGKLTLSEARHLWFIKERQYAKRQLTWFRRDKEIHWFDPSNKKAVSDMTSLIRSWYTR